MFLGKVVLASFIGSIIVVKKKNTSQDPMPHSLRQQPMERTRSPIKLPLPFSHNYTFAAWFKSKLKIGTIHNSEVLILLYLFRVHQVVFLFPFDLFLL